MGRSKKSDHEEKAKYELIIKEEAGDDISQIYFYYEAQREGLGDEFFAELEAAFHKILRSPISFRKRFKQLRALLLNRFPYHIIYIVEKSSVFVFRILHGKRNPKIWRRIARMK